MGGVVGLYLVNAVQMPARNPAPRFAGRKRRQHNQEPVLRL